MKWNYFSPELTSKSIIFEVILFVFFILILIYGIKNYRFFIWRFFALFFGVFCFEGITGALWINSNLGIYSYIHNDISWVLTIAWSSIIIFFKFIFDKFFKKGNILREFLFVIITSSVLGLLFLIYLKWAGIFSYSKEMQDIVSSGITVFGRPLESIIYFPTFIFVVFSFYKYWELAMFDKKLFQKYKINFSKDILLAIISIFSIGYIINPLLITSNYINYFLISTFFVLILMITNILINIVNDVPLFIRFISGSFIFTSMGIFLLSFFVKYNLIEFSTSIKNTYTNNTFTIPYTNITDVEGIAVLLFSYLLISMVKYFKIITDNKKIILDEKNMTFKGWKDLLKISK